MDRRGFFRTTTGGAVAVLSAASFERVRGANERIGLALMGCGGRGIAVARHISAIADVEYAAVCDVYDDNVHRAKARLGGGASTFKDFRHVLDLEAIDAVHIATPDHWHAIPAVFACRAGKHVYLEKPFAHNVREGGAIVRAVRDSNVVLLTGTQQRSAPHIAEAAEIVQGGKLGVVHQVRVWNAANRLPDGIGTAPDAPVPEGLDWDFYLGPAPRVPFNRKRFLHSYREFSDYAGGRITDFGVHRFDSVHQIMGADAPRTVSAAGARFALGGMGDHPDVLLATYEYPGFVLTYEATLVNGFGAMGRTSPERTYYGARGKESRPNGMTFHGSEGTLLVDRTGYEVIPEDGGELERVHTNATDATALHAAHFIRCLRGEEKPRCDALVGHRSTLVAHLGNIAYRTGLKLRWEAEREDFRDAPAASELLRRAAREPWDLLEL